jgi:hypothetical protein
MRVKLREVQKEEAEMGLVKELEAPREQQICLEALKRIQQEGGTLAPAEVEACQRMPEVIREELEKKAELEEVRVPEEEGLKEPPSEDRPELKIYGHDLFTRAPRSLDLVTKSRSSCGVGWTRNTTSRWIQKA